MLYRSKKLTIVVGGPFGLYTKPENRADRVTHPFSPPTAAIGVPKAIFWHPEADPDEEVALDVDITAIKVLNPIQYHRMTVNEVGHLPKSIRGQVPEPVLVDSAEDANSVRQTSLVLLKDPKFMYEFFYISPKSQQIATKAAEIFQRRLSKGQHFRQPCLGRRRYLAWTRPPTPDDKPINESRDFGRMPWGREFIETKKGVREVLHTFHAVMEDGVVQVPSFFGMLAGEEVTA